MGYNTINIVPPASGLYNVGYANGRMYFTTPTAPIAVPDFDAAVLLANGWQRSTITIVQGGGAPTYGAAYLQPWVPGTVAAYTKTLGTANAGSTIGSSTLNNWYDAGKFTFFGGAKAGSSGTSAGYAYNPTEPSASDIYLAQFVEFVFTGSVFEVAHQIPTASSYPGIKMFVNGQMQTQYAEQTSIGTNAANDVYLVKFDFGSAATRTITLWIDYGFKGIYATVAPTASTRQRNGKRLVILGHSWTAGQNCGSGGASIAGTVVDNFPLELALETGHDEVVVLGEPGTGWFNDGANTQLMTAARTPYNSTRRLAAVVEHNPSTLLIFGGVNDLAVSGFGTNVNTKVTQALNALLPNISQYSKIFICGGEYANLYAKANYQTEDNQIATGIANCSAPSRVQQICMTSDNTPNGTQWLTGTGNTNAPAGDGGTCDTYEDSSQKHINKMGHYWMVSSNLGPRMNSLGV